MRFVFKTSYDQDIRSRYQPRFGLRAASVNTDPGRAPSKSSPSRA